MADAPIELGETGPKKRGEAGPPAILLMGATATGKTALAVELARRFPLEIVSVDSSLVYRHMNIGTAKPDAETLAAAPHHLIDLVEPHEAYSAGRFRDDALIAMREITERGNVPLLVGGTMLYFKALREGLAELPRADPAMRMVIDEMAAERGWPALHEELRRVDPETAARLAPNDSQRIQRALEVYYVARRPMSALLKKPRYVYFPYRAVPVALMPADRERLHARIDERFELMLESGLIGEVRWLRANYGLDLSQPSMRAVGYRQVWKYLEGEYSLTMMRERAVAATRQLAKRQMTWIRSFRDAAAVDPDGPTLVDEVAALIEAALKG
ncbi:MAG TPA: tRNA (adenosine(37)-N6)-dimethylallyltransferase MiaA [Pelomicrobium sp.]|nr:tRNA (adenosine(37)-N6)-dimethylallyltransferase MiaA [Pelomicrobium sp.]